MTIEESIHVSFDETNITSPRKEFLDDIVDSLEDVHNQERNIKRERHEENKNDQDDRAQDLVTFFFYIDCQPFFISLHILFSSLFNIIKYVYVIYLSLINLK